MLIRFQFRQQTYSADLSKGIDLSLPLRDGLDNPNCFWAPAPEFSPVRMGDFVGSTAEGGAVNFYNVRFNPHGNGTHTECVGHIARERFVLRDCLLDTHCIAKLASVYPRRTDEGDRVIFRDQLEELLQPGEAEAFVLRTLPNDDRKKNLQYTGANPPYLHHEAAAWLVDCGIRHLLIDLPSVDREEDGGQLLAHRAFWRYPRATRADCTITELIYAPETLPDGRYLLNIQTAAFELDASPSRPVLFALMRE
ncbi:MAG: cyclase family protein [Saprospiraceae bacterium]|nr:cyclase family protein [Saprospiraceae bacterium]